MTTSLSERSLRFRDIISEQVLAATNALVIGCGAIGAAAARQLAQMGVGNLWLFDPDLVSEVNLGPQGFPPSDKGRLKVASLASDVAVLNPTVNLATVGRKFTIRDLRTYILDEIPDADRVMEDQTIVFLCVDSLRDRLAIVEEISHHWSIPIIDARMNAWQARILTIDEDATGTPLTLESYAATIDPTLDSLPEPCTGRSSNWTAVIAAGFMVAQMVKVRTQQPLHGDFTVSMNSCMISRRSETAITEAVQ